MKGFTNEHYYSILSSDKNSWKLISNDIFFTRITQIDYFFKYSD